LVSHLSASRRTCPVPQGKAQAADEV